MHPLTTLSQIEKESLVMYEWHMRSTYPIGNFFKLMTSINDKVTTSRYTCGMAGRIAHNKSTMYFGQKFVKELI
jgi:hypothetical protein